MLWTNSSTPAESLNTLTIVVTHRETDALTRKFDISTQSTSYDRKLKRLRYFNLVMNYCEIKKLNS